MLILRSSFKVPRSRARARVCVCVCGGLGENIIGEKRVKAGFERLGGNGIGGRGFDRSSEERLGEWPIDGEDVLEKNVLEAGLIHTPRRARLGGKPSWTDQEISHGL